MAELHLNIVPKLGLKEGTRKPLPNRPGLLRQEEAAPRRRFGTALLIVGTGTLADGIIDHLRKDARSSYRLIGCLDRAGTKNRSAHVIGDFEELQDIVDSERVRHVVVALSERRGALPLDQLLDCKLRGVRVEDGTAFYETLTGKIPLAGLNPGFFIFGDGFRRPTEAAKRGIDLLLSTLCLLLSAPLFLLLPLLIRLTSQGPVFYRQERVGQNGSRFSMLKFRSMVDRAEGQGKAVWAVENDPRVTRIGKLMREFRLDELPQLLNVFRGDMSFVGPRPERPEFVETLSEVIPFYPLRHTVKPGITGWAQVRFHYGATVQDAAEKLQYDLYYIKHMSVVFDCRIAFRTIRVVLFRSGAR